MRYTGECIDHDTRDDVGEEQCEEHEVQRIQEELQWVPFSPKKH